MIEKNDLDSDPVVRFQHRHYILIALVSGLLLPALIGSVWGDALGGFVWGGIVARLLIWHCTFVCKFWTSITKLTMTQMINSLAHWTGEQPYSDENSSRGTFLIALCTSGEGNHNFHHAFPCDYRNGPAFGDWDPTAWILTLLHRFTNQIPLLHHISEADYLKAKSSMLLLEASKLHAQIPVDSLPRDEAELPVWNAEQVREYVKLEEEVEPRLVLLIDDYVVDASSYAHTHPGGQSVLRRWSIQPSSDTLKDSTKAFHGLVNRHSKGAKETMCLLRIAKLRR